eukprot:1845709-Pyramimonas_sp.AAC.1
MGPSESQGLEAECGGRGASIDEVVGAAKVRVEMGGAKPRATTPAGDIASLGLAWRPTAKTVATAAETRGSVSRERGLSPGRAVTGSRTFWGL